MFSYFKGGIKDKWVTEEIPAIEFLLTHIRHHLKADAIKELRRLYQSDLVKAKEQKCNFPYITPHGTFATERRADKVKSFSGYLYFDIDSHTIEGDIKAYKAMLLEQYRDVISVLGTSISGKGLFFYVRIANKEALTRDSFDAVYDYFLNGALKALPIDRKARGVERAQLLPYDPDVYHNPDCAVALSPEILREAKVLYNVSIKEKRENKTKRKKQSINRDTEREHKEYRLDFSFSKDQELVDIGIILKTIHFDTAVPVAHPVVEVKPAEVVTYHPPRVVKDGTKHKQYLKATNILMYNNPGIELRTILSYINYLNEHRTDGSPMDFNHMVDIVSYAYYHARETGELLVTPKLAYVHFNPACSLSRNQKQKIANTLNRLLKRKEQLEKLVLVAEAYKAEGYEVSRKNLVYGLGLKSAITGNSHMSAPTVRKYFQKSTTISDLKHQLQHVEEEISTYIQSLTPPLNHP